MMHAAHWDCPIGWSGTPIADRTGVVATVTLYIDVCHTYAGASTSVYPHTHAAGYARMTGRRPSLVARRAAALRRNAARNRGRVGPVAAAENNLGWDNWGGGGL